MKNVTNSEKSVKICTDKKEKKIFLIYKEIQMGSVAKSYMRKGFLIYEEMRKYLTIYDEAVSNRNRSLLKFLIYEENFIFFISVGKKIINTQKSIW
jgi:hypothetical protein